MCPNIDADELISQHREFLKDTACLGQRFVSQGAAMFYWSVLPLDALLRLDGEEEFVLYLAPAGKNAG